VILCRECLLGIPRARNTMEGAEKVTGQRHIVTIGRGKYIKECQKS